MDTLISRHADALYHFLVTLSDPPMAEDASQHTWLKLIEKPSRYQAQLAQFRTWLFTAGRNTLVDELRRLQRWNWQTLDEVSENDCPAWDEDLEFVETEQLAEHFDHALTQLPFAQREALMLQLEGFTLDDISKITFENKETIKSRLRFARQSLKKTLEVSND